MVSKKLGLGMCVASLAGALLASGSANACPRGGHGGGGLYGRMAQARQQSYSQPVYNQPVYSQPAAVPQVSQKKAVAPKVIVPPETEPVHVQTTYQGSAAPTLSADSTSPAVAKGNASYGVEIRYPGHYHDFDWHLVDSFPTQQKADTFAALLQSNLKSQQDFLVRVSRK